MRTKTIFREITTKQELESIFQLRYKIYEKSRMHLFLKPNERHLDIDVFDMHAKHYGYFHENEIAGYIRIVKNRYDYFNTHAAQIGIENNFFDESRFIQGKYMYNGEPEFPFLSYPGIPKHVWTFYSQNKSMCSIVEGSRLIVTDKFRSARFALSLIECAVIAAMHIIGKKKGMAIVDCFASQESVYELFGFRKLPDINKYYIHEMGVSILALSLSLSLSLSNVPSRLHDTIQKMSAEFESTNQIERAL